MHSYTDYFKKYNMRSLFVLFLLMGVAPGYAQSLKDSLFSGKLKVDSALLIKSKVNTLKPAADTSQRMKTDSVRLTASDTLAVAAAPNQSEIRFSDNTRIWKKFIDELTTLVHAEIATSRKIKRGTYSVLVDYEIGTDGMVSLKTVSATPASEYLVALVKEKMTANVPRLAPLVRDGVARKSQKRQLLIFTKDKN
jgi:hypothetical protein